jgi:hypothetical protein
MGAYRVDRFGSVDGIVFRSSEDPTARAEGDPHASRRELAQLPRFDGSQRRRSRTNEDRRSAAVRRRRRSRSDRRTSYSGQNWRPDCGLLEGEQVRSRLHAGGRWIRTIGSGASGEVDALLQRRVGRTPRLQAAHWCLSGDALSLYPRSAHATAVHATPRPWVKEQRCLGKAVWLVNRCPQNGHLLKITDWLQKIYRIVSERSAVPQWEGATRVACR